MNALNNSVRLIGRLGGDMDFKTTGESIPVGNVSIAIDESYIKTGGEKVQRTAWFDLVIWRKNAENARKYFLKGNKVIVEGRLKSDTYTDDKGQKHTKVKVEVESFMIVENIHAREGQTA